MAKCAWNIHRVKELIYHQPQIPKQVTQLTVCCKQILGDRSNLSFAHGLGEHRLEVLDVFRAVIFILCLITNAHQQIYTLTHSFIWHEGCGSLISGYSTWKWKQKSPQSEGGNLSPASKVGHPAHDEPHWLLHANTCKYWVIVKFKPIPCHCLGEHWLEVLDVLRAVVFYLWLIMNAHQQVQTKVGFHLDDGLTQSFIWLEGCWSLVFCWSTLK